MMERGALAAAPELPRDRRIHEATAADDEELRCLLRSRPMEGSIRLALTREPRFQDAARIEGERHRTVVVRDGDDTLLGFGSRSVRRLYLGSKPRLVGYLGQLRSARGVRGLRRLRQAFAWLRRTRRPDEAPFDLTAILEDNESARRLLERGLPGLPAYRPLAEIRTLILSTRRRSPSPGPTRPLSPGRRQAFLEFLHHNLSRQPLASVWKAPDFEPGGRLRDLCWQEVRLLEEGGRIVASGALWDQRSFKQTRVEGYGPWLGKLRPMINLGLRGLGQPTLPPPGAELAMAFVTALAVEDERPERAIPLLQGLCRLGRKRGIDQLVLSFARGHPLLEAVRRHFSGRVYRSKLYAVCWAGDPDPRAALGDGLPYLEAAFL